MMDSSSLPLNKIEAPYGYWSSPITASLVAKETACYDWIEMDEEGVYWIESRPLEGGRNVIMHQLPQQEPKERTPFPYHVCSRVHEYGGRAYAVDQGTIYFVNFEDQRLYCQKGKQIVAITDGSVRLAELVVYSQGLLAVGETHLNQTVENFIVRIDLSTGICHRLAEGSDFYAAPTLRKDEKKLCWLSWNHPHMPWNQTTLWRADFIDGHLENISKVAGGDNESILQPNWSANGGLYYLSDKNGWWNLYCQEQKDLSIFPLEAEFGKPLWVLGTRLWRFNGEDILAAYQKEGSWQLVYLSAHANPRFLSFKASDIKSISLNNDHALLIASFPKEHSKIMQINLKTFQIEVFYEAAIDSSIESDYYSEGQSITFHSPAGHLAHAFYYAPLNKDYTGVEQTQPPLLVRTHGGPTAQSLRNFNLQTQYWTSRGFAVLDVNYGGSSGYGRAYRNLLKGQWGIVDRLDCEAGASYLIQKGLVDPKQTFINGNSAGGYTTLCALVFGSLFTAGASYYGISDLELIAKETHKFEKFYLDWLIGPYPTCKPLLEERSPLKQKMHLHCPVIFFQGKDDAIVPANQADLFYHFLKERRILTQLVLYEGEHHGFRKAESIKDALEKELHFYLALFPIKIR